MDVTSSSSTSISKGRDSEAIASGGNNLNENVDKDNKTVDTLVSDSVSISPEALAKLEGDVASKMGGNGSGNEPP